MLAVLILAVDFGSNGQERALTIPAGEVRRREEDGGARARCGCSGGCGGSPETRRMASGAACRGEEDGGDGWWQGAPVLVLLLARVRGAAADSVDHGQLDTLHGIIECEP